MNDYRKSVSTVGAVLIIFGLLDFAWGLSRAAPRGVALNFGTLAIIPGILLRRTSLKTARFMALLAAFLVTCYVAFLLVAPFTLRMPLDLALTYLRLRPFAVAQGALLVIGPLILWGWIYRRLTAPVILAAMDEQQIGYRRPWQKPSAGFVVGAALAIVLAIVTYPLMSGVTVERAKIEARKKVGGGYSLFVSSWGKHYEPARKSTTRATVIAYNRHDLQDITVQWEE
ncbi:MAG: hypothetical protein JSV65_11195 [Armatimonadota bacterium]|nr:MAG: hypothetical protein JSV65_11195 [Armatimonadota bacterium]